MIEMLSCIAPHNYESNSYSNLLGITKKQSPAQVHEQQTSVMLKLAWCT